MSNFSTFMQHLAEALKFPTVEAPKSDALLIVLKDKEITIQLEVDHKVVAGSILLFSQVLEVSEEAAETIYIELLKYNDDGHEIFSYNPDKGAIYMHRRVHALVPTKELNEIISHFEKKLIESRAELSNYLEERKEKIRIRTVPPSGRTQFKA